MKYIIYSIFVTFLLTNQVVAQLFEPHEFCPGAEIIKVKYYNGTGGDGYWSLIKLDSLGRKVEMERYRGRKLLEREYYVYNVNNDLLFQKRLVDINGTEHLDTTSYEYSYKENRIVYQKRIDSNKDSAVFMLVNNVGDSVLTYHQKEYHFLTKTNTTKVLESRHTLKYRDDLLVQEEIVDQNDSTKIAKYFEYFPDGRLKRRRIDRVPNTKYVTTYSGGPGSDDEFYKYEFDKFGRIKSFYRIIGTNTFKIASYRYK
jgi:hypothetical protein